MVAAVLLSIIGVAGLAMLLVPPLRNAGLFALSGTVMGFFYYQRTDTVPEVQYIAFLFWLAAAWLAASHLLGPRRGRTS